MLRGRVLLGDIGPGNADYSIGNDNTHFNRCPYYVSPPIGSPNADRITSAPGTPIRLLSASSSPIDTSICNFIITAYRSTINY